jgi:uncharacterized protein YciW
MPSPALGTDVIDRAAGLAPGDSLHAARRFRAAVVEATQASHDALLEEPVRGLSRADRLRVAELVCVLGGAASLGKHYAERLAAETAGARGGAVDSDAAPSPAFPAMVEFADKLTTDPRRGDRAAIDALRRAGLPDAAIVALAQLVAFLSYQLRTVAGLKALRAFRDDGKARGMQGAR